MLDLFRESFWVVPSTVFLAGLIGSPHCLSMCGPLIINFTKRPMQLFCYQAGRMISYVIAGFFAGGFGRSLFKPDQSKWLSLFSLGLIGLILMVSGYRAFTGKSWHVPVPKFFNFISKKSWKFLGRSQLPLTLNAGIAGGLTVFLPCGHLYSFLLGAMATGSSTMGAIFMFAFWLGSTPLMSLGSFWLHRILNSPQLSSRSRQRWAGVLLVIAGLFSIYSFAERSEGFSESLRVRELSNSNGSKTLQCH